MGPNSDSPVLHYLTTIIRPPAVRKEDPPQLTDILAVFLNSKTLPNDSAPAPRVLLTATPSPPRRTMTSNDASPQGSTRGPGPSQGVPRRPSGGAPGSGTNDALTSPPPRPESLAEVQERLSLLLPLTAPDTDEQGAELRELTDQVARESGADQIQIIRILQEMGDR